MRTSSAANVGKHRDSENRQRQAIQGFADHNGIEIVEWFYDAAVSGADVLESRPGFTAMLERLATSGARTIVVESANRFARDLMVQEVGYARLRDQGIELIAADSPQCFVDETPTAVLVRQVLGAIAQFDKAATVAKLKGARDRKSKEVGKRIEGRKGLYRTHPNAVLLAKRLRRSSPKTGKRRSLRNISDALEKAGYLNERGQPFNAKSVKAMIEGPKP